MRKTSVYLGEVETRRLTEVARLEGRSQADVIRAAIAAYVPEPPTDRDFLLFSSGSGDGRSAADLSEEELLEGFGE